MAAAPLQNPGTTVIVAIGTIITAATDAGTTTVMVGIDAETTTTADLVAEEEATVALGAEGEEFASTFEILASVALGKTADLATT